MRRVLVVLAVVGSVVGVSAPALAQPVPPVPVSVSYNGDSVCVYGLTWGGKCVQL